MVIWLTPLVILIGSSLLFGGHWLVYGLPGGDWLASEVVLLVALALVLPRSRASRWAFVIAVSVLLAAACYRLASLAVAVLLALTGLGGAVANTYRPKVPIAAPVVRDVWNQANRAMRTLEARAAFRRELEGSGAAAHAVTLPGLRHTDVVLGFIESYGMVALREPRFRAVVRPAVERLETAVSAAGLHMVSGRLLSPVQGGQSWLAHGTALSGLWLDNQLRYDLMLQAPVPTLIDDFSLSEHRTLALMPAITRYWPEGESLGYDRILDQRAIDYAGPAFNWVTMPDQFTWRYLARRLSEERASPLFAEVALISSHAPWTPILPLIEDWERIGNGQIFDRWKGRGETPAALWQDMDRVRRHYARPRLCAARCRRLYRALSGRAHAAGADGRPCAGPSNRWGRGQPSGSGACHQQRRRVVATLPRAWVRPRRAAIAPMDPFREWMIRGFGAPHEASSRAEAMR